MITERKLNADEETQNDVAIIDSNQDPPSNESE